MAKCEFSSVSTFGSLMRFMTDFEETAVDLYQKEVQGAAAELFAALAEKHKKRLAELELARREKLREEILEPVTDFDSQKYKPKLDISDPVKQAIELESKAAQFFTDAAKRWKTIQGEISNICARFGKQSQEFLMKLKAL
jgi:rubrerythrin